MVENIGSNTDSKHWGLKLERWVGQERFRIHARKLSMLDAMLDYADAGPNPKHDPTRGRGGGGGRNP
ncbi:hypothetical protein M8C21_029843 [Ambrosia artemisiifolia]|uniref:Uncharacterized protein n=1 Tax=Ambrosia artemisiifolia TaxID=4212 RepID=A0AAD5CMV1_AMBAR|nr:hypothetical protein M8C21_029843 [Ambrosia artemisiifolia]